MSRPFLQPRRVSYWVATHLYCNCWSTGHLRLTTLSYVYPAPGYILLYGGCGWRKVTAFGTKLSLERDNKHGCYSLTTLSTSKIFGRMMSA